MAEYRRMNIKIAEGIDDRTALYLVSRVVENGRISTKVEPNDTYCFATRFHGASDLLSVMVIADKTRAGHDTFWVYDEKGANR